VRVFEYGVVGKPKAEGVCRGIQGGSKRAKLLVSMEEVTIHDGDHFIAMMNGKHAWQSAVGTVVAGLPCSHKLHKTLHYTVA
jgi:hypothetical protein